MTSQKTKKADTITTTLHPNLSDKMKKRISFFSILNRPEKLHHKKKIEKIQAVTIKSNIDFWQFCLHFIDSILKIVMFENNNITRNNESFKNVKGFFEIKTVTKSSIVLGVNVIFVVTK